MAIEKPFFDAKSKFYSSSHSPKTWTYPSEGHKLKHDSSQCVSCVYRSGCEEYEGHNAKVICDYLAKAKQMRDCPASPYCTKYVKGAPLQSTDSFNPNNRIGFKSPEKFEYLKLGNGYSK